jgi:hypothetical protein
VLAVASQQLLYLFQQLAFSQFPCTMILFPKGFKNMAFYDFFHAYLRDFGNMEL